MSVKKVAILGSTGSVGKSALDIVRRFPKQFKVSALLAGGNTALLNRQIKEFKPFYVGLYNQKKAADVRFPKKRSFCGDEALVRLASLAEVDTVVFALPGFVGYTALFAALEKRKTVALANKEIVVSFGSLIRQKQYKHGARIVPVDSEHSALFQAMAQAQHEHVKRLYLTCSGGALYHMSRQQMRSVSVQKVLRHPRWKMGQKITVDSASLINKGLEVIEAHVLFGVPLEDIRIIIHPEAIVHGIVEFVDSTMVAVAGITDMRLPLL